MVEVCLKRLTALNKPFKYVVTCVIMQKNGAGLHTASSCYWDNTTDGESPPPSTITKLQKLHNTNSATKCRCRCGAVRGVYNVLLQYKY